MYSIVSTAIIRGINSEPVQVEVDVSDGMPMFEMVGFLAAEVKEARERVRAALRNFGYAIPAKRITVNLSPANIKKTGSAFDLPVAVAVLAALGVVKKERLSKLLVIGEIGLSGMVAPIEGALPIVADAGGHGFTHCMAPYGNLKEAEFIQDVQIVPVKNLKDVVAYLNEGRIFCCVPKKDAPLSNLNNVKSDESVDFSQINGQRLVRRASEVAAAGMHDLLMIGPPGAGKTMIARRIPTILPPMCDQERLELAKIYSVNGMLMQQGCSVDKRPFRSPHHTVTPQGLVGGGLKPKSGEVTLAHNGVLFLDELAEFQKSTLELLRQPMEEKEVRLSRLQGSCSYPANFMLVAAMNPCPCGAYPDMNRCHCTQSAIDRYIGKISQPLLDRIDICVEASQLTYQELTAKMENESSEKIRERIGRAWRAQKERFSGSGILFNSKIPAERLKEICGITQKEEKFLEQVYKKTYLTARSYHKILRVSRTIADLEGCDSVKLEHISEAVCYRSFDKKYLERW